jgi:hypothetical protein
MPDQFGEALWNNGHEAKEKKRVRDPSLIILF